MHEDSDTGSGDPSVFAEKLDHPQRQIRSGLSARVRERYGGAHRIDSMLQLLRRATFSSSPQVPNNGRDLFQCTHSLGADGGISDDIAPKSLRASAVCGGRLGYRCAINRDPYHESLGQIHLSPEEICPRCNGNAFKADTTAATVTGSPCEPSNPANYCSQGVRRWDSTF